MLALVRGVYVNISLLIFFFAQPIVVLRSLFDQPRLDITAKLTTRFRLLFILAHCTATRPTLLVLEKELGDLLIVAIPAEAHLAIVAQLLQLAHFLPGHEVSQDHLLQHSVVFVE